METDGKKLLLAVAVAMGLMLVWNMLFPPKPPKKPEGDDKAKVESAQEAQKEKAPTPDTPKEAPSPADEAEAVPRGPEKLVTIETDEIRAVFSSYGGVLESWKLLNPRFREGKDKVNRDLVETRETEGFPFQTNFINSTFAIPGNADWQTKQVSPTQVEFHWESANLSVTKRYTVIPEDFLVKLDVEFKNLSGKQADQRLQLVTTAYQNPSEEKSGGMSRVPQIWEAACYVGDELEAAKPKALRKKTREWSGDVAWAGFSHSYFLAAMSPKKRADDRFTCRASVIEGGREGAMKVQLEFPVVTLSPNDPSFTWTVSSFLGPKYVDKLDHLDEVVGYQTGFRNGIDLGFFQVIARPMLWVMKWFYGFIGNWGISIILLTLIMKGLLLPWTHKSMVSMKKVSALTPRMKELQEKYKDDKAAQQQRIMELYKQEGVSPLSGCLPMLLQTPIWIALYRMLMYAAELYHAPFIPGWIDDLTAPDPYYVLPILLVIVMFVQAKLTPATGTGAQQKMLKYGMPLIFGGMSFVFPTGLTLYIFTNTVLTGVHHLVLRRGEAKEAVKKVVDAAKHHGSEAKKADESVIDTTSKEDEDGGKASSSRTSSGGGPKKSKKKKGKRR